MEWFVIVANGVHICVLAATLDDAVRGAAVHLAFVLGSPGVEHVREILRFA